jgi:hypothetical protein
MCAYSVCPEDVCVTAANTNLDSHAIRVRDCRIKWQKRLSQKVILAVVFLELLAPYLPSPLRVPSGTLGTLSWHCYPACPDRCFQKHASHCTDVQIRPILILSSHLIQGNMVMNYKNRRFQVGVGSDCDLMNYYTVQAGRRSGWMSRQEVNIAITKTKSKQ